MTNIKTTGDATISIGGEPIATGRVTYDEMATKIAESFECVMLQTEALADALEEAGPALRAVAALFAPRRPLRLRTAWTTAHALAVHVPDEAAFARIRDAVADHHIALVQPKLEAAAAKRYGRGRAFIEAQKAIAAMRAEMAKDAEAKRTLWLRAVRAGCTLMAVAGLEVERKQLTEWSWATWARNVAQEMEHA